MAEIVPLLPLVDEDAQVRRIAIQSVEELVEVGSGERCLQVNDDINTRLDFTFVDLCRTLAACCLGKARRGVGMTLSVDHRVPTGRNLIGCLITTPLALQTNILVALD